MEASLPLTSRLRPLVRLTELVDPPRLVIDLEETALVGGPQHIQVDTGPVERVRTAQFNGEVTVRCVGLARSDTPSPATPMDPISRLNTASHRRGHWLTGSPTRTRYTWDC